MKWDFKNSAWSTDWSERHSDDQAAIIERIRPTIDGREILHLGTGDSSFALALPSAAWIDSITICEREAEKANRLNLENYDTHLLDKHTIDFFLWANHKFFDVVVDNNPFAFARSYYDIYNFLQSIYGLMDGDSIFYSHIKGIIWSFTKANIPGCKYDKNGNYFFESVIDLFHENGFLVELENDGIVIIKKG